MKEKDQPGVDRWADEPDGMSVVDHSSNSMKWTKENKRMNAPAVFYYGTEPATKGTAEECNTAINKDPLYMASPKSRMWPY